MGKLAQKAVEFALSPPASVKFTPVSDLLIPVIPRSKYRLDEPDYVGKGASMAGEVFDPMQRGDVVVLCHKSSMHFQAPKSETYETWEPAVCRSTGKSRSFELLNLPGVVRFEAQFDTATVIYRVPYVWRDAVAKLRESYDSRDAVVRAMMAERAS